MVAKPYTLQNMYRNMMENVFGICMFIKYVWVFVWKMFIVMRGQHVESRKLVVGFFVFYYFVFWKSILSYVM